MGHPHIIESVSDMMFVDPAKVLSQQQWSPQQDNTKLGEGISYNTSVE